MNNCKNCKFCNEIFDSRVSCDFYTKNMNLIHESPLHIGNIPEYAKLNGWFRFPHGFDPDWVDNCNAHKQNTVDIYSKDSPIYFFI